MEVAAAKQLLPVGGVRGPNSPSSSTSSSSSPSSAAASPSPRQHQQQPVPAPSPRPVPRIIDTTPFPTTFVQADTASFKQVVQRLTGSDTPPSSAQQNNKPATNKAHHHHHHLHHHGGASGLGAGGPKKQAFKLYERRIGKNNLKMIAPLAMAAAAGASPRKAGPEVLSPSILNFPSLALGSPVTPLVADPFNRSPAASASPGEEDEAAERAAIARKGFFLHPSPRGAEPPRLLPLFPVTSPRVAAPASSQ